MATFRDRLEVVLSLSDKMASPLRKAANGIKSFARDVSRQIFNVRNAVIGLGAALTIGALGNFTAFAGQVETISSSFESLAETAGESADEILEAMNKASEGTIDRFNLMKLANNAFLTGIAKTPDEFERIVETSLKLGRALGIDATEAYEKLSIALARQSKLRLDDFGLIIDAETANKKYAESLGKTVEQLSDQEKAQAFVTEAYEIADKALEALGGQTANVSRAYEQFLVALKDTRTEVADALAPVLTDFFTRLAGFVKENKPLILNFLADLVEGFGSFSATVIRSFATLEQNIGRVDRVFTRVKLFTDSLDASKERLTLFFRNLDENLGLIESAEPTDRASRIERLRRDIERYKRDAPTLNALVAVAGSLEAGREALAEDLEERRKAFEVAAEGIAETSREAAEKLRAAAEGQRRALADAGRRPQLDPIIREDIAAGLLEARNAVASFGAETEAATLVFDAWLTRLGAAPQRLREIAEGVETTEEQVAKLSETIIEIDFNTDRFLVGARDGLNQLADEFGDAFEQGRNAVVSTGNALVNNFSNGMTAVITQTQSLREAFANTAKAILEDITRIITRLLIVKAIEATLSGFGFGTGSAKDVKTLGSGEIFIAKPGRDAAILGTRQTGGLIPETGLYQLHAGERLIPAETTRALEASTAHGRAQVLEQHFHVHYELLDPTSFNDRVKRSIAAETETVARSAASGYQNDPSVRAAFGGR